MTEMARLVNIIIAVLFFALFVAFGAALRKRRHPEAKKDEPAPREGQGLNDILGYDFIRTVSVDASSPAPQAEEEKAAAPAAKPEQRFGTAEQPEDEEEEDGVDDEFGDVQWQIKAGEEDSFTDWIANSEQKDEQTMADMLDDENETDAYGNPYGLWSEEEQPFDPNDMTDEDRERNERAIEQLMEIANR